MPLLHHVAQIPEGSEPHGQCFERLDFREGFFLRHLPSDEGKENQQLAEVKLISLVLCFMTLLLQLVEEVARSVHLHLFDAISCEVDDEPHDLHRFVLPDELTNDQLEI
jgi:hypothetical protein